MGKCIKLIEDEFVTFGGLLPLLGEMLSLLGGKLSLLGVYYHFRLDSVHYKILEAPVTELPP